MAADPPGSAAVPASFAALLSACQNWAVHLEMRDSYTPNDPDYLRWRAGDHFDPLEWGRAWIDLVSPLVKRGVAVRRARIVSEPVSDYIHFEYGVTPLNLAAGEQVRWLPRRLASDLCLPGTDFWVFDDRLVLFNHFAGDGSSGPKEQRDEPEVIALCTRAFEEVWQRAIPHERYKPA